MTAGNHHRRGPVAARGRQDTIEEDLPLSARPFARLALGAAVLALAACNHQSLLRGPADRYATPADDGAACYPERQRYYAAVREAQETEQLYEFGAFVAQATIVSGLAGQLGWGGTLVASEVSNQFLRMRDAIREDRTRIAAYNASLNALTACRVAEARQLQRDLRRGRVTRSDAQVRVAALRQDQIEDVAVARDTTSAIEDRTDKFSEEIGAARTRSAAEGIDDAEVTEAERNLQTNQKELATTKKTTSVAESKVTDLEIAALPDDRRARNRAV
jgi:hypothetical protein